MSRADAERERKLAKIEKLVRAEESEGLGLVRYADTDHTCVEENRRRMLAALESDDVTDELFAAMARRAVRLEAEHGEAPSIGRPRDVVEKVLERVRAMPPEELIDRALKAAPPSDHEEPSPLYPSGASSRIRSMKP